MTIEQGFSTPENLRRADGLGGYTGDEEARRIRIGSWAAERFADSQAVLDANSEVKAYVDTWDDEHLNHIASIHETLAGQDMLAAGDISAYPNIPAAAGQEDLRRILELYRRQDADPTTWESLFLVNQVSSGKKSLITPEIGATLRIVDKFRAKSDMPNLRIAHTLYSTPPKMGAVRGDNWDVRFYDVIKREEQVKDGAIGISQDADPRGMSTDYISSFQRAAEGYPAADMFATKIGWHKEGDVDSDPNRVLSYWEFLREERQKIIGRFPISEISLAIRLGSYAAVGAFNRQRSDREALDIYQRILNARQSQEENAPVVKFIYGISVDTDARRPYDTIANGLSPHLSWDRSDRPFLTGIDPVRLSDSEISQIKLSRSVLGALVQDMESIYLGRLSEDDAERLRQQGRQQFQFTDIDS